MISETAIERAHCALEGLSVGDAFGDQFFVAAELAESMIDQRTLPPAQWAYTDDTEMSLSVVAVLREGDGIVQDRLAKSFAARYTEMRGYGPNMHRLLRRIRDGEHWSAAARDTFEGQGSHGNGASMRAAPIGGYFADDLDAVVMHAVQSAEVTHSHPEGIAGAVAVALAASWAWRLRGVSPTPKGHEFLDLILEHVPGSAVREGIRRARNLDPSATSRLAVAASGNGTGLSAQDTVPFALWCAARHLNDYEEALWLAVSGLGDRDTICAIVGGIVALSTGAEGIPNGWLMAREPLPGWADFNCS